MLKSDPCTNAVRDLIVEELADAGLRTLEAEDGRQGLAMILKHRPDIVISDITMPEMDGAELLAELQIHHPGNWCTDQISTICIYAAGIENSLIDPGCRTNITSPAVTTSAR